MPDRSQDSGNGQVFFRYETADGRLVIVDSISNVPTALRDQAQRIELGGRVSAGGDGSYNVIASPGNEPPDPALSGVAGATQGIDVSSFGLGVGAGLLVAAVLHLLFVRRASGASRFVFGGVLVAALTMLGVGAYLGWMRRTTGVGDDVMASPARIVEDARDAVRAVEAQRRAQDDAIEAAEALAK